jgi:ubiquinone biosynthesis protein COQ9
MAIETPSAALRARLLDAMMHEAARLGWTGAAVAAAARTAGLTEAEAHLAAPGGAVELLEAFAAWADDQMVDGLARLDLPRMKIREKVTAAIRLRLEAAEPFKHAARRGARLLAVRRMAPLAARLGWATADRIWRALGDVSTDGNYYSKRAILSAVHTAVFARWLVDASPGHADTWFFLDRRIENVMQFEKMKGRAATVGLAARLALARVARWRYGNGAA